MNWNDERVAFESRVQTNFTSAPVQYSGIPLALPDNTSWVRMQLLPTTARRISLGPNALHREYGQLLFSIFGPANDGTAPLRVLADELSVLFREAIFSYGNSGRILCQTPVLHDRGIALGGVWYQLNLLTVYWRDVILA